MKDQRQRIEFFIYPNATALDITGPLDVFAAATLLLEKENKALKGYTSVFTAARSGPVRLGSGLCLHADAAIGSSPAPDIFVVPGGIQVEQVTRNPALIQRIHAQAIRAGQIVSVCGGAFILAACGLLKGKQATTHWCVADRLADLYPDITVQPDAIYIQDGHVWTSAGVTAGIDLALAMVEEHHSPALAVDVARMLVLYLRRSGGQSQFSAPMTLRAVAGKPFRNLHDWLFKNIAQPITIESMAAHAAMSPRNFARMFKQQTRMTPARYLESMRLNQARELLETTDIAIAAIADACGFVREERLRRTFLRHLGITPSRYRIHFRSHH